MRESVGKISVLFSAVKMNLLNFNLHLFSKTSFYYSDKSGQFNAGTIVLHSGNIMPACSAFLRQLFLGQPQFLPGLSDQQADLNLSFLVGFAVFIGHDRIQIIEIRHRVSFGIFPMYFDVFPGQGAVNQFYLPESLFGMSDRPFKIVFINFLFSE